MQSIPKILLKGIVGLFAFPVFSVLTVGLYISALLSVAAGLGRTFGMNIAMNIGIAEVPRLLSLPFGLLFSLLFIFLGTYCWKILRQSYRFVKQ